MEQQAKNQAANAQQPANAANSAATNQATNAANNGTTNQATNPTSNPKSATFNDVRDQIDIHAPGDHLLYAEAMQGEIRLMAVQAQASLKKLRDIHDLAPAATYALGQLTMASALLAGDLKDEGSWLSLLLETKGDLGRVVAECDEALNIRAKCQNPLAATKLNADHKLDLSENIGGGSLVVLRSFGKGEPFVSRVELQTANIAADLTYYLAKSEQRHSAIILGVDLDKNGVVGAIGLLVEALPNASEQTLAYVETRLANLPDLNWLIKSGFDIAQIMDMLLMDSEIRYLKRKELKVACTCSVKKMAAALCSLGKADREAILNEPEITMQCDYCKHQYKFTQPELATIFAAADSAS